MKKKFLLIIIAIIISFNLIAQKTDTITDKRDGKKYETITIGDQTWLAVNLTYKSNSGCWAYNNDQKNVPVYGYLYNWETAKTGCPAGTHLPSDVEWSELFDNIGGCKVAGVNIKSFAIWKENLLKTYKNTFNALPAGYRGVGGAFHFISEYCGFWSSTQSFTGSAWGYSIRLKKEDINKFSNEKVNGYSVRCIVNRKE
ncbi:MAG: hypothetical protein NTZ33_04880 [Bacteroidetes bacterium]|nr:hypothetical protein [Bacteroidota bacterium]